MSKDTWMWLKLLLAVVVLGIGLVVIWHDNAVIDKQITINAEQAKVNRALLDEVWRMQAERRVIPMDSESTRK